MARSGKGELSTGTGFSTGQQRKRGLAKHGLDGWDGNRTIFWTAEQMAKDRGMEGAEITKDHYLYMMAERDLIQQGNDGGDPHSKFRHHEQQTEIDELYKMMEEKDSIPEANAEPAAEIEEKMEPITYSSAVQDAKERTKAFMDGSKESFNFYKGAASTENNQVEDPDSELPVANNKASSMNQQQSDPMLQSRHEDRSLNFR